jgi:hypothetical protein
METLPEAKLKKKWNPTLSVSLLYCVVFYFVVLQLGSMDLFLTTDVNSTVH